MCCTFIVSQKALQVNKSKEKYNFDALRQHKNINKRHVCTNRTLDMIIGRLFVEPGGKSLVILGLENQGTATEPWSYDLGVLSVQFPVNRARLINQLG